MNLLWFKRNGIFFVPISVIGWLIAISSMAYAIIAFIDIDSRSHSVSDTLMNFVFNLLIIFAVYSLIGCLASRNPKN